MSCYCGQWNCRKCGNAPSEYYEEQEMLRKARIAASAPLQVTGRASNDCNAVSAEDIRMQALEAVLSNMSDEAIEAYIERRRKRRAVKGKKR